MPIIQKTIGACCDYKITLRMLTSLHFSTLPRVIALALLCGTKIQHSFLQFPDTAPAIYSY